MLRKFRPCYAVRSRSNRPDFPNDMTEEEQAIMREHSEFRDRLLSDGSTLVTGPKHVMRCSPKNHFSTDSHGLEKEGNQCGKQVLLRIAS